LSARDLTITINGKTYRVININAYGVGFLVDSPAAVEIGSEIGPMVINGPVPVRVAGIARHVSQFQRANPPLAFKPGWICGAEFSVRHNRNAGHLLQAYLKELLDGDDA